MVYTRSEQLLKEVLDEQLSIQTREGLAKIFTRLGCKGVAREVKAGRKVVKNVEFGMRACVHSKIAPRVDPITGKFYPQTKRIRKLEENFIATMNKYLVNGGYNKMSSKLLPSLRRKDKAFEKQMKKRFKK